MLLYHANKEKQLNSVLCKLIHHTYPKCSLSTNTEQKAESLAKASGGARELPGQRQPVVAGSTPESRGSMCLWQEQQPAATGSGRHHHGQGVVHQEAGPVDGAAERALSQVKSLGEKADKRIQCVRGSYVQLSPYVEM